MRRILLIMLLIPLAVMTAAGEDSRKILSEKEFMDSIKQNLTELKSSEVDVLISEEGLKGTLGISDIQFEAGLTYGNTKGYTGYDRVSAVTAFSEASKKFVSSGTALSAGVEYNLTNTDYGTVDTDTYAPRVYVNVSQPLLQNAMGKLDSFAGANAALALEIAKISRTEKDMALLNAYKKLYYLWCSLEQSLMITENSIENAESVLAEVERRYRNGLADQDEVDQSRSSLISYREQYEGIRVSIEELKASLSPYIQLDGVKPDRSLFQAMYTQAMTYKYGEPDFSRTRSYRMMEIGLEQAGLSVDYYKDKMRPQLILSGGVAVKSSEDELGDSFAMSDLDYNAAITFSMPIGNRSAKADAAKAELQLESLSLELDSALKSYLSNVRKLKAAITSSEEMYRLRNENIDALQSQYEIQIVKYRQARVEISNVIEADNRIAAERINIINLQYGLIDDYLEFKYLTNME